MSGKTQLRPQYSFTDRFKPIFFCDSSIVHVLCPCMYGLKKYDYLNNNCLLCFLIYFVM